MADTAERKIVYKRVYDGDGFMIRWRDVDELTLVEYRRSAWPPRTVLARCVECSGVEWSWSAAGHRLPVGTVDKFSRGEGVVHPHRVI